MKARDVPADTILVVEGWTLAGLQLAPDVEVPVVEVMAATREGMTTLILAPRDTGTWPELVCRLIAHGIVDSDTIDEARVRLNTMVASDRRPGPASGQDKPA